MIDSHCHLAGHEFEADLDAVVARARDAGVEGALVILSAGDAEEARRARRVHEAWPGVRFAVGIHPHQAGERLDDLDERLAALDRQLSAHGAVALGEIGLDYHYDFSPRPVQQEVFRRQLALARDRRLPVVIHTREATADTFSILSEQGGHVPVVFHCFTGDREMAAAALDLGAWLSFAGIVTFPKAEELREVARMVPAARFLIETDSPYLAPVPHRGKRNEPSFVPRVAATLAEVRGQPVERIGRECVDTFAAVFGEGSRSAGSEDPAPRREGGGPGL